MNLFDNQQCMAITFINVSKFKSLTEKGNLEVRPIGGRILLPGKYTFATDPEVRYEECHYPKSNNTYLQVLIKSDRGWVDLGQLLKKTKVSSESNELDYVNDWVIQYADIVELAVALAGHTLEVSRQRVNIYSIYRDGQRCNPYINGVCYKARIVDTAD